MDAFTSTMLTSAAYDIVKHGFQITSEAIRQRLGQWITQDVIASEVAEQLCKLGITDELSPIGIERRIEATPELLQLIQRINANPAVVAPSSITTVNQHHSGSGDNVAGNKITCER
ncbi:hypothetical protein [Pseudomonas sp. PNPG3]|uniref:GapS6a family protein n=1 Tax=Pseudomonas sp. PNPG3 TaxID=2919497 RepID=UPI001FFD8594|nr:hypothetical protein [Pseudomonas sp. PNPG3]MCK2124813.1 hypothetical protein [Pseudomonas sp. PNPG3]